MPEPKGISRLEFVPIEAGNAITLVIRDIKREDFVFVLGAEKLPAMIGGLLRMASHPAISHNFTTAGRPSTGSKTSAIPLPYESIGVAFIESSGKVGLCVGFPGGVQFLIALEPPMVQQLIADLQFADGQAKGPGNSPSAN